ncbi:metallophosphoesterase family protein [Chloroflexi bacterium TSY]|nr:metallophosphoesterase family protein [Chloroflexi bacterium TSY]
MLYTLCGTHEETDGNIVRIALISDIHGNFVALEKVLAELEQEPIDQYLCLGDVVENGPQPREVIESIRALNCPIVMGNTDERIAKMAADPLSQPKTKPARQRDHWTVNQLSPTDHELICQFRSTIQLSFSENITLLGYHGSPRSNRELLFAYTSDEELESMFEGHRARIFVGGHTHRPMVRPFRNSVIVNPGSVGLPYPTLLSDGRERRPPSAEYAILTVDNGQISIDLRSTPIDRQAFLQAFMDSGMPFAERWAAEWEA